MQYHQLVDVVTVNLNLLKDLFGNLNNMKEFKTKPLIGLDDLNDSKYALQRLHLSNASKKGGLITSSKLKPKDIKGMKVSIPLLVWKYNKKTKSKEEFIGEFKSYGDANNKLGTTGDALARVARGKCKQAKGYYAEFKQK